MGRTYRTKESRKKQTGQQEDRFLTMILFQAGLCLLVAAAFFTAVQSGDSAAKGAKEAAKMICGTESTNLTDYCGMYAQKMLSSFKRFWSGGAEEILEQIQEFINQQIVPPEELPPEVIGYSGAGGALPAGDFRTAAEGTTLAPYLLTAKMCSPVSGLITSKFGWREHPISAQADFHKGIDIAAPIGTTVAAVLPGVVEKTGYNDSYGNFVVLRHSENLCTTYNHCSKILAKEGEQLSKGDRIALVGNTGVSTGPHLHFEVIVKGMKADPLYSLQVKKNG